MSARSAARADAPDTPPWHPRKRVLTLCDFTNYTRFAREHEDGECAALLHEYYGLCHEAVDEAGGEVIKFLGDACLAAFPPERAADAVAMVEALVPRVRALAGRWDAGFDLGANVHMATVAFGHFGPPEVAHKDVLGAGVNHLFLMGGGPGIRISEPVYRALPSDARTPWKKEKPPAKYTRRV